MADRPSDAQPADCLQAIEQRQDRLLAELEGLNGRIEAALESFGVPKPAELAG